MGSYVGHPYYQALSNMAIIRSLAVGKARKSAGNLTFRTVRGRTIASEKRGKNPITRGDGMSIYQFTFAIVSRFMAEKRIDIDLSFDKSRYGSQSNNFYKMNKVGLEKAFAPLSDGLIIPTAIPMSEILDALATYATENPESIIRVKKAGMPVVYLTGEWTSAENPQPPVVGEGIKVRDVIHPFTFTAGATSATGIINTTPGSMSIYLNTTGIGTQGITAANVTLKDMTNKTLPYDTVIARGANSIEIVMNSTEDPTAETDKFSYIIIAEVTSAGTYVMTE